MTSIKKASAAILAPILCALLLFGGCAGSGTSAFKPADDDTSADAGADVSVSDEADTTAAVPMMTPTRQTPTRRTPPKPSDPGR
jgi:hypothetical protein